jgi:group I intron endonuclease
MYYIYGIFSEIKKKVYIGQTNDQERRERDHWSRLKRNVHPCSHLQRHYNKYGKEDLIYLVLEYCKEEQLSFLENRNWNWYNSLGFTLFNREMSAETGYCRGKNHWAFGRPMAQDIKDKISDSKTGKKVNVTNRGKTHHWYGKQHSLETRDLISQARKGRRNHLANFQYLFTNGLDYYFCSTLPLICNEIGINVANLNKAFNRKVKHTKGYYPVSRTNLLTGLIEYYETPSKITIKVKANG